MEVFGRIVDVPVEENAKTDTWMIDATWLKKSHTACGLGLKNGGVNRRIGTTKDGRNTKGHFLPDVREWPMRVHPTTGQAIDCKGLDLLAENLPAAKVLFADRAYVWTGIVIVSEHGHGALHSTETSQNGRDPLR